MSAWRDELRRAGSTLGRTFLRFGGVTFFALLIWFSWLTLRGEQDGATNWIAGFFVAFGFALTSSLWFGAVAAIVALSWHLFGAAMFLPFIVLPLFAWLFGWLGGGVVGSLAMDLLHALEGTAKAAVDGGAFDALRVAHAGGPVVLLILAVMLPFVLLKALPVIFGPSVLLALIKLLLFVGLLMGLALMFATLVCAPALGWSFVRRLKRRNGVARAS